ncbi:MAG: tetratricopeptide repeat protein, partial [Chloroflexia bacterium]|nr:tetratricopeptide repeat protein [Chloroflexia bacterium]
MNDPKAEADALVKRGHTLLEQGDLPQATDLLNRAVKLYWA